MITANPSHLVVEQGAGDRLRGRGHLLMEALKNGGARIAISIGPAGVTWTLDRDEALAVAAFLQENSEEVADD